MSTHEHIIIIVLKEKIQFYELNGGRPEILKDDKEDYLQAPSLPEAIAKIKDFLYSHYKKDGWHCFKFTVIYEKYNIETVRLFATEFNGCARLDFISAETLITMNSGKIKPPETGVVKFGESLFRLEEAGGDNNGEGGRQLVPISACEGECGEITSNDIVLYAVSGGGVVDSGKLKELECEVESRREELKAERNQIKELNKKIITLEKQVEEFKEKAATSLKAAECADLYQEICKNREEFNKVNEYIGAVKNGEIDSKKISYDDYLKGKRPAGLKSIEKEIKINLGYEVDLEMIYIEPGKFIMGNDEGGDASPPHQVTISKGFYIGKFPVTQGQWVELMKNNPSNFKSKGLMYPVENVSWEDCQKFIEVLNKLKKYNGTFRLPTEAEWEYACRAGSDTAYYWEDDMDDDYCWYSDTSDSSTHPVGKKKPNEFGLYDMSGNVWEWCQDWYDGDYYKLNDRLDPKGPAEGSYRVLRGGSWFNDSGLCRSASRGSRVQSLRDLIGFRLALSPGQ